MRHITNVLVHSNRCEVVDGHAFATGDKGLPHIHLQFLYMFGENSLQGKNLECKYLLPNGQYSAETVKITGKNEVTFPIHYSCFTVNGWTTLRITLINGSNRVTLEDIIIKTKETKLGEPFSNTKVEEAIAQAIEVTTSSISAEGETIKEELRNYIQKEKSKLKGEKGKKENREKEDRLENKVLEDLQESEVHKGYKARKVLQVHEDRKEIEELESYRLPQ